MAQSAERVSNLVRNTRAQAAERGQLGLLHALENQRRVLEEYYDAFVSVLAEPREVRLDFGCILIALEHEGRFRQRILPFTPAREARSERRRDLAEQAVVRIPTHAEQAGAGFVDEADLIIAVDDDDTFAQVLNDVLVELDEVLKIDAALRSQGLGVDDLLAQQLHDARDDEDDGCENTGCGEVRGCRQPPRDG